MSLNEKFGVKTPMGVERFEAHFWALFSTDHEVASSDRKVFPNKKIANASNDDVYLRISVHIFPEGRRQETFPFSTYVHRCKMI